MEKLRASAAALPAGEPLSWARAGAENTDELADWTVKLGNAALYKVHSAVVASGARCSDKMRAQAIAAAKGAGARTTDILPLITSESARAAIQKDPHAVPTVEALLTWMYGLAADFSLPSLGGKPVAVAGTPTTAGGADANGDGNGDAGSTVLEMFQTAIFGTPSKGAQPHAGAPSAGGSKPATPTATPAAPVAKKAAAANGGRMIALKPEQLPLLWQLADALSVRGLKARLAPVFELHALPAAFVMAAPAFERLKLLVRALELHADEVVGALCEQLKLSTATTAALRDGMAELAVAAAAVDLGRYDALVACGLLPAGDAKRLAAVLDRSSLRVANEAQVHDLLLTHFKASGANATVQEALWATCRFSFLPADRLVALAERPNVPARWLALACAQRAAASGGAPVAPPTTGGPEVAARLQARECYKTQS